MSFTIGHLRWKNMDYPDGRMTKMKGNKIRSVICPICGHARTSKKHKENNCSEIMKKKCLRGNNEKNDD